MISVVVTGVVVSAQGGNTPHGHPRVLVRPSATGAEDAVLKQRKILLGASRVLP